MISTSPIVKKLPPPELSFPPAWTWFVDETIPVYVKSRYSPRESWKDKPFSREDVSFFSKGVTELSELFTEERPERIPAYFQHPKFRSAYLLYFLPLQMAKFVTLLELHTAALEAALEHGRKTGVLRVADLGAGPGTASLALLLRLLQTRGDLPPIELWWFDTQKAILEDGQKLALSLAEQFPKLRGKVSVKLFVENWWDAPTKLPDDCSLIFLGHVLNEAKDLPNRFRAQARKELDETEEEESPRPTLESVWSDLLAKSSGGGTLFVEPASRGTSHYLSRLRNRLFENQAIPASATSLWGPCPHAETCPLSGEKTGAISRFQCASQVDGLPNSQKCSDPKDSGSNSPIFGSPLQTIAPKSAIPAITWSSAIRSPRLETFSSVNPTTPVGFRLPISALFGGEMFYKSKELPVQTLSIRHAPGLRRSRSKR